MNIDFTYISNRINLSLLETFYVKEDDTIQGITEGSESWERIEKAIEVASAEVNGYCEKYGENVNWNPVPELIVNLTFCVFQYNMYASRPDMLTENEIVLQVYKNATDKLKDIRSGKLKLFTDTDADGDVEPVVPPAIITTNKTPADRVFRAPLGY